MEYTFLKENSFKYLKKATYIPSIRNSNYIVRWKCECIKNTITKTIRPSQPPITLDESVMVCHILPQNYKGFLSVCAVNL